jgi:protein Tex
MTEMEQKICERLSKELNIPLQQVNRTVLMLDEGNTVPFIARYRKEATGGLLDEQLRRLEEKLKAYRSLEKRRAEILRLIEDQGVLTDELQRRVNGAATVTELDDLYRPFRPKKRTRASMAREKGLEQPAMAVLEGNVDPAEEAKKYIDPEKELFDSPAVLQGVSDIIAEIISDDAEIRYRLRRLYRRLATVETVKKKGTGAQTYDLYDGFSEPVKTIKNHRVLAVSRGVKEAVLSLKIKIPEEKTLQEISNLYPAAACNGSCRELIGAAVADSFRRLIHPSLEKEIWQELLERAIAGALDVFKENLKKRLLVPPVRNRRIIGWDPGFRTGCKLACVSENGVLLETATIFPVAPKNDREGAEKVVLQLVDRYKIDCIALGNGTASRESEAFIAELISEKRPEFEYAVVNEAGASVYSASEAARREFPALDVSARSAVSIARRLQDPLAELVKIDPKAIGVGQYQHDMPPKQLDTALTGTVESCVNTVGVELNSASAALLSYVAGINVAVAERIVDYRNDEGLFQSREELKTIPGLGPKIFKQCAGFLRLPESENYLERSSVHPESYELADRLMEELSIKAGDLGNSDAIPPAETLPIAELAARLGAGEPTVIDILAEFRKPGRDLREDLPGPVFSRSVLEIEDLEPGMILYGIVRNIVDFGAFIDIGVHQDGLVHISEIADRYISHPLEVLQIEAVVSVKILSIDRERCRISLSIKQAADRPSD